MSETTCVIVPAKDEAIVIRSTLQSLIEAGIEPCDIYVADDGSSDGTGDIARAVGVSVLRNETNIGKAGSVERLVRHFDLISRYEYIALMDADTRVNQEYFTAVRASFRGKDVAVVCGQPQSRPHNWLTAYRCFTYYVASAIFRKGQNNMGVINVAPGCTTTYRSNVFAQLTWSSDTIVEDMDVTVQIYRKKLGRIVYQPKAIVYTQDPRTIRDYLKQTNRWDVGAWQVVLKYNMMTGLKKIDWEYKLLMGEGLFFGAAYLLLPLLMIFFMKGVLIGLLIDFIFTTMFALMAGIAGRRFDVIIWSPIYPLIRFCDCAVYWYSFWSIMIRRNQVSSWNSVGRYVQPEGV